jgi:hypothetical protein
MKKATKTAITSFSQYAQHGLAPVAPRPEIQHFHIRASGVCPQHVQVMITSTQLPFYCLPYPEPA